jgi:NAD(P)-dependent dehydrogenase (short-subunit alcohol dehydrogenase family)
MGMTSSAGLTDYCASKAAVNAFHDSRECCMTMHIAPFDVD